MIIAHEAISRRGAALCHGAIRFVEDDQDCFLRAASSKNTLVPWSRSLLVPYAVSSCLCQGSPAFRGHTEVPPYQAFELRNLGADRRVRPGQRMRCKTPTRTWAEAIIPERVYSRPRALRVASSS